MKTRKQPDGTVVTVHDNKGLRKLCDCARRKWAKCPHSWYFNFKPRRGPAYQFSLDAELDCHVASKEDAETEADRIRGEIRAGTFKRAKERRHAATLATTPGAVTLEQFAAIYVERVSELRERNKSWKNDRYMFAQIVAFPLLDGSRLGDKSLSAVTEDDVEAIVVDLRKKGRAASTQNQYVTLLKAAFRWATKKGYLATNPISEDAALKRAKVAQRNRRLMPDVVDPVTGTVIEPGEERRLLATASPRLQNVIIGAIETCCRRGELLSLQWRHVDLDAGEVTILGEKAKDAETRKLPISTRLAAVLTMAKTDPAGEDYKPSDYVFGDCGQQVDNVKRAWETCVLKAHGHNPVWNKSALAPASRAVLKVIDLHFHDLRHEGASRLLEAGWPLHHIQQMLGHATLDQTSTYLNVAPGGLRESMRRMNEIASRCNSVVKNPGIEHPLTYNKSKTTSDKVSVN